MNDDERQARLAALRSNLAAATPGPWEFDSYCRVLAPMAHLDDAEHYGNIVAWVPAWHGDTACKPHDDNAELIANAPADLAWLLAEVERLEAERDESVANMTAASAAFARLQRNAEAWNEDSKRLHNEYLPTSRIMDEVLATRDAALMKAWAERDAATARAERAEAERDTRITAAEGKLAQIAAILSGLEITYGSSAALAEQGEAV